MGRRPVGAGRPAALLAAAWAIIVGGPAPAARAAQEAQAAVLRVYAGDSLLLRTTEGVQASVRLLGIEAPRLREVRPQGGGEAVGQPFSGEAKKALEDLVLKRKVRVEFYARDPVLRQPLAVLFVGDENVNVHLVRGGLARMDRRDPRVPAGLREALERAEAEARREGRGLWMFE
jgi:endonuclease YncB( thermonuclease family)